MRKYLAFNGQSSKDYMLYLSGPGVYDSPKPDVEEVTIPGLNGSLIQNNAKSGQRRFENVDIKYEAFFFDSLPAKTAAVKNWLLSPTGYRVLSDTFDPEFFRLAVCTRAIEFQVSRHKVAEMELVFNCKPQRWSVEGQIPIVLTAENTIRNPYGFIAQPTIRVYGTGKGVLTVGDTTVTIYSFEDYVDLNCETHNAYNASGFCNDTILSDDFPTLAPGLNSVSWTGGITSVQITPRWWTL